MTTSSYRDAVEKLNSTQSGFKALAEKRGAGQKIDDRVVEQMREWLRRVGHHINDLGRLNVVHVAGTKGKGTTCAFVNSILQNCQQSLGTPRKIGLYTSPHLVTVTERIRINSLPISEELFAKYFFEVWNALESSAVTEGVDPALKPSYFRFLTLMAFHVFLREGVDAAIFEVGVGGEFDSTNIVLQPAVTGITSLGIDHVYALGDTIDKIAWHKAGIFKHGSPAFTVSQVSDAMMVLEQRAKDKNVDLGKIKIHPALFHIDIKPAEEFQRKNASLAITLAHVLLNKLGVEIDIEAEALPVQFSSGLENVVWRGRCEVVETASQTWHVDGAHTEESLRLASAWFGRVSQVASVYLRERPRVLIFNQQSASRDSRGLLQTVHHELYKNGVFKFDYALFCTNVTYRGNAYKVDFVNRNADPNEVGSLSVQKRLAVVWRQLDPSTETRSLASIQEAIEYVRDIKCGSNGPVVFVTGSFHLVGGVLAVLEGENYALQKTSS